MSESIFRLENADGYGPFNAFQFAEDIDSLRFFDLYFFASEATNAAIANGIPDTEDGIMNRVTPEYKFGVPDLATFNRWFPPDIIEKGKELGFRICKYEVPDFAILHSDSGTQVAFDRFDSVEEIS